MRPATFIEFATDGDERPIDLLDLDKALDQLSRVKERYVQIVELRFFSGLENDEIAEVLGLSVQMVRRNWVEARGWLVRFLDEPPTSDP